MTVSSCQLAEDPRYASLVELSVRTDLPETAGLEVGLEATRWITQRHPEARAVILTSYADDGKLIHGIRAGAAAYVL
jgi:DNA-binding NarL/FixJ family response regulator